MRNKLNSGKNKDNNTDFIRRFYTKPNLIAFGSLTTITQTAGNNKDAMSDGGQGNMDKTH
jgi:hypothetical protein